MTKIIKGTIYLTLALCSCSHNEKIDREIIYSTLNSIIQGDTILASVICNRFDIVAIPDYIQTEFFENDRDFIEAQLKQSENATVDTARIFFYWKSKIKLEKSVIDTTCSHRPVYKISYPIYSKDLNTVIVKVTQDCNCSEGGEGFTGVYRFDGKRWIIIKKFHTWVG